MLKNLVRGSLARLGYGVVGKRRLAALTRAQAELADAHSGHAAAVMELARVRAQADQYHAQSQTYHAQVVGYKAAYEATATELADLRAKAEVHQAQALGYKGAYEATCTELSATKVVLKQLQPDGDIAAEAIRKAPTPKHRLTDTPGLAEEVRAEAVRLGLPDAVVQILQDPDFSVENQTLYRRLFEFARPVYWDRLGSIVSSIVNRQYLTYSPRSDNPAAAQDAADQMRREGLVKLDSLLTPQQVAEMQRYFLGRGVLNGHIPTSARHRVLRRFINHTAEDFPLGCYTAEDVAAAPHVLELALNPFVLDSAAAYFGCAPRLCWLQSWWNFAGPGDYPHRQNGYHRDSTDFRMFWLYVYLTDVGPGCGPHRIIRRSADYDLLRERCAARAGDNPKLARVMADPTLDGDHCVGAIGGDPNKAVEGLFDGLVEELTGPAGTMFFTRGIDFHKVTVPLIKKRQILAIRFTMTEFPDCGPDRDGDPLPGHLVADRVGDDEQLRHVTGLLFDWDKKASG